SRCSDNNARERGVGGGVRGTEGKHQVVDASNIYTDIIWYVHALMSDTLCVCVCVCACACERVCVSLCVSECPQRSSKKLLLIMSVAHLCWCISQTCRHKHRLSDGGKRSLVKTVRYTQPGDTSMAWRSKLNMLEDVAPATTYVLRGRDKDVPTT